MHLVKSYLSWSQPCMQIGTVPRASVANISQCSSSPTSNASQANKGSQLLSSPSRTAKRPSLSTPPLYPARVTLTAGSSLQVHVVSCASCAGGSNTSTADNNVPSESKPPAQTMRLSGRRAAQTARVLRKSFTRTCAALHTNTSRHGAGLRVQGDDVPNPGRAVTQSAT
jgi:hypothetical protein